MTEEQPTPKLRRPRAALSEEEAAIFVKLARKQGLTATSKELGISAATMHAYLKYGNIPRYLFCYVREKAFTEKLILAGLPKGYSEELAILSQEPIIVERYKRTAELQKKMRLLVNDIEADSDECLSLSGKDMRAAKKLIESQYQIRNCKKYQQKA